MWALLCSLGLSGCGSISEKVGQTLADNPMVGLPAGVPARPATPAAYPAVHDMPPVRPAALTGAEQIKMEDELVAARTQQQTLLGPQAPPPAAAAAPAKPQLAKKAAKKAQPAVQAKPTTPTVPNASAPSVY